MATELAIKVCMIGDFAVGKTSLVRRFVHQVFSDKYLTTVGVKIDTRTVKVGARAVKLVVWDIAGDDDFDTIKMTYLRGAAGYLLVLDGTRPATLDSALRLRERIAAELGELPHVCLLNKSDLSAEWALTEAQEQAFGRGALAALRTSARTGDHVEAAFQQLAVACVR